MVIHFNDTEHRTLEIEVDDDSYRYRAVKDKSKLVLYYSLTHHVEIPVGAWVEYEGEVYTLEKASNFTKNSSRDFSYTLTLECDWSRSEKYKVKNPVDGRLKFSYTAKPREFIQLLVDNINMRESGWAVGECIDAVEQAVSFNHVYCSDALTMIADAFETEWEVVGKTINLRKVEYFKDNPLPLSYGKGNGFKTEISRTNQDGSRAVEILYVQGGTENINPSKYGNSDLLLPKSQELEYEGHVYVSSSDGLYITRKGKEPSSRVEDSLDCSSISPKRVGEVSTVVAVNEAKHFYDFIDSSIPSDLNFAECLMEGETMTVIFQSGMLAGKEFEVKYVHEAKGGKAGRRFEIVPQDIDGLTMPDDTFKPVAGDKYAVFHISLPDAYVCNNADKSGASWDMFREAARYFYEHEGELFTFKGTLDGIWAKKDWLNIGGQIKPGAYVLFSDEQFHPEGSLVRITEVKDFVNNPHSPVIELSNAPVSSSLQSTMHKVTETEVVVEEKHREALRFTKRRFRDSQQTIEMLGKALLENFTDSINPLTVETMAMLVGDESLQFRFVESKTNPVPVPDGVAYDPTTKTLSAAVGVIQHMTLGIDTISASHANSAYKFWRLASFQSPPLIDAQKKYYLYAKVFKNAIRGSYYLNETPIGLEAVDGYYHLLIGVLNSEYEGTRSFVSLYGFTEILPGRITTDKIVSSDGKTYFDLLQSEIGGKINFKDGLVSGIVGIGNDNGLNAGMSGDGTDATSVRFWAGETAQNRTKAPFRVVHDGSFFSTKGTIGGWSITDAGIVSNELTQYNPGDGSLCKSRMYLNSDGTIDGELLKLSTDSGQIKCLIWDDPILEWMPRYLKMHARVAVPFETTSALYDSSGAGPDGLDVFYITREMTNNIIISPISSTEYYDLIGSLEEHNGVTLRIYNPTTRSGNFKPANGYLRYREALGKPLIPFLGKFTGTELSIPVGKMVVITGVSEQVAGGSFGQYRLKWYVEVTA